MKSFVVNNLPKQIRFYYGNRQVLGNVESIVMSEVDGKGTVNVDFNDGTYDTWQWQPVPASETLPTVSTMYSWQIVEKNVPINSLDPEKEGRGAGLLDFFTGK